MPISLLFLAAVPLAWLVPNHYDPWLSAWSDGLALALLGLAALTHRRATAIPLLWAVSVSVATASVLMQYLTGEILFGGDALMVVVYLTAFTLAVAMGASASEPTPKVVYGPVEVFAVGVLTSAIASVGIATAQWTRVANLGIYAADLPPGWRPFGNVGQPNHLCTIAFLGLCSLALLYEARRIGRQALTLGSLFLLFGMVVTGSRTGWLQIGGAVLLLKVFQRRGGTALQMRHVVAFAIVFVVLSLSFPAIERAMLLSVSRPLGDQIHAGIRLPFWWTMLDAVWRKPLWGYGWQQVVMAQAAVALDHAPIQRLFEHSHNIVLDLMLWAGVPVGVLLVGLSGVAIVRQGVAVREARAAWLFIAVTGVLLHAMLEFPLEYAYFLIPVGFALGALHSMSAAQSVVALKLEGFRFAGVLFSIVLGLIGIEYLRAEKSDRLLRLESAHIGTTRIESVAPRLRLLTQLGAFEAFARTEAKAGMTPREVERMRHVAQRYEMPPVLFRYALAAGLNGDNVAAQRTLARLCKMHLPARCDEARDGWHQLQSRYPALRAIPVP